MREGEVVVDVDIADDGDEMTAKFSAPHCELNVHASRAELMQLASIREANWDARKSIRAGTSAGSPVFWSCAGNEVSALIGNDDESWDIALTIPVSLIDALIGELRAI